MNSSISTKDDVIVYLINMRDNIVFTAQECMDMRNEDGAKILRLAAESLTSITRYIVNLPYSGCR
jgi:hypothetical protein